MMRDWFARIFLSSAQRALLAQGPAIFLLHKTGLAPRNTRDPFDYVDPDRLETRLAALGAAGLKSISMDAVPQGDRPGQRFVISFDDGYRNVLRQGLPVLQRQGIQAIQFLVASRIGGHNDWDQAKGEVAEDLMTEAEVREWLAAGQQIGSHGLTHRNLKKLSEKEARAEIFDSKKKLEDQFGVAIRHFSYPSGRYTPQIRDLVEEAGYLTASTVEFGVNGPGTNPFELRRIFPLSATELLGKARHRLWRKVLG